MRLGIPNRHHHKDFFQIKTIATIGSTGASTTDPTINHRCNSSNDDWIGASKAKIKPPISIKMPIGNKGRTKMTYTMDANHFHPLWDVNGVGTITGCWLIVTCSGGMEKL